MKFVVTHMMELKDSEHLVAILVAKGGVEWVPSDQSPAAWDHWTARTHTVEVRPPTAGMSSQLLFRNQDSPPISLLDGRAPRDKTRFLLSGPRGGMWGIYTLLSHILWHGFTMTFWRKGLSIAAYRPGRLEH